MKVTFQYNGIFNKEYVCFNNVVQVKFGSFVLYVLVNGFTKLLTYSLKRVSNLLIED